MDRDLAAPQGGQFLLVVVDENDLVPEVCKAGACDQTYVSRTHYGNAHHSLNELKSYHRAEAALRAVSGFDRDSKATLCNHALGNLPSNLRKKLKTGMDFRLLKAEATGPIMAVLCALHCRGPE